MQGGLDNLVELNLSLNNFTKIGSNSFQHLKNLKRLGLKKNQIEQIDSNIFGKFRTIEFK